MVFGFQFYLQYCILYKLLFILGGEYLFHYSLYPFIPFKSLKIESKAKHTITDCIYIIRCHKSETSDEVSEVFVL